MERAKDLLDDQQGVWCPCVSFSAYLSCGEIRDDCQQADSMSTTDSTYSTVMLRGMNSGTHVMTNWMGGVSKYVAEACAALISDEGRGDESVEELLWLERKRNWRKQLRPRTRTWADWFAWGIIAGESRVVHAEVFG